LAEALRLRVAARRRGDAVAEQPVDDEVEAPEIRERVALDREARRLGHERPEALDAELALEPSVRRTAPRPHADVGVPALVARARPEEPPKRYPLRRPRRRSRDLDGRHPRLVAARRDRDRWHGDRLAADHHAVLKEV